MWISSHFSYGDRVESSHGPHFQSLIKHLVTICFKIQNLDLLFAACWTVNLPREILWQNFCADFRAKIFSVQPNPVTLCCHVKTPNPYTHDPSVDMNSNFGWAFQNLVVHSAMKFISCRTPFKCFQNRIFTEIYLSSLIVIFLNAFLQKYTLYEILHVYIKNKSSGVTPFFF